MRSDHLPPDSPGEWINRASSEDCAGMTEYAVEGRYPGFNEPLCEDDWKFSVKKADDVIKWVKSQVSD